MRHLIFLFLAVQLLAAASTACAESAPIGNGVELEGGPYPYTVGSDIASPEVKAKIGRYKLLGKEVIKTIPQGRLIEFPGFGHAPQIEDPAMFHKALLDELMRVKN